MRREARDPRWEEQVPHQAKRIDRTGRQRIRLVGQLYTGFIRSHGLATSAGGSAQTNGSLRLYACSHMDAPECVVLLRPRILRSEPTGLLATFPQDPARECEVSRWLFSVAYNSPAR